jgi:adenylosuccinate lyase
MIPEIKKIISELTTLSETYADLPMLARTHGQSASPTTFGKEMKVFVARLEKQLESLKSIKIQAKINGATGNYNALVAAYPNTDWITFSEKFIESFNANRAQKLEANLFTTQIECHDSYVAIFDTLRRINMILLDFSQDMWRYISDGYVGQKTKATEVGSSTMPHKVNPIDFENAEGNFGIANALFNHFAMKLPVSRLQRDLSDSTVERAFGTAFAHTLIAYQSLQKGLSKISVNSERMQEDLTAHPEVLAEAIQTVLRREGVETPYEKLKELTRGKTVTMDDFAKFIDSLEVSAELKKELHAFTPENYIGLATILAKKKS